MGFLSLLSWNISYIRTNVSLLLLGNKRVFIPLLRANSPSRSSSPTFVRTSLSALLFLCLSLSSCTSSFHQHLIGSGLLHWREKKMGKTGFEFHLPLMVPALPFSPSQSHSLPPLAHLLCLLTSCIFLRATITK